MAFGAPGNLDDLADDPNLRQQFIDLWNDNGQNAFLGDYVTQASRRSLNYVDPRDEPATTEPVKVPWNGFPRALSRWFDDETSTERKASAEAAADIGTPILAWVAPGPDGNLQLFESEAHRVAFFGNDALALARPFRQILADGSIGSEVEQVRRQQDEYLEWHATRDAAGHLVSLAYTAEPPDYWIALAQVAPQRVLQLYQKLIGPQVQHGDLFHTTDLAAFGRGLDGQTAWFNIGRKGEYDPLNPWTTTKGIVHLTHRANTLGAEVFLAADASHVVSADVMPPPTAPNRPNPEILRIACGGYGGINRSSDPLIGLGVGRAVFGGARVTLTDPIGLYIANPDISGLRGPQGQPVGRQALTILRGDADPFDPRILRFEVKLPAGLPFRLDDCTLDGRLLTRGGQVARLTTMHLYAQTYADGADVTPQPCSGRVCRHPVRTEVFGNGSADPGRACPDANDLSWLLETPLEIDALAAIRRVREAPMAASADGAPVLVNAVRDAPVLSVSRAPQKP